jgi:plastocyanin
VPRNNCGNKTVWIVESNLLHDRITETKPPKDPHYDNLDAYCPRLATKCMTVLTPFLRHLNTGTLAIFLFVALAFLTNIRGREVEAKGSIPELRKNEIAIANFSFSPKMFTVPAGGTVTWANHDKVPHVISSADAQLLRNRLYCDQGRASLTPSPPEELTLTSVLSTPRMTGQIIVK